MPKAAYRSSCRDKHNRPRCDSNPGPLTPHSDALTTRPLRPVKLGTHCPCVRPVVCTGLNGAGGSVRNAARRQVATGSLARRLGLLSLALSLAPGHLICRQPSVDRRHSRELVAAATCYRPRRIEPNHISPDKTDRHGMWNVAPNTGRRRN